MLTQQSEARVATSKSYTDNLSLGHTLPMCISPSRVFYEEITISKLIKIEDQSTSNTTFKQKKFMKIGVARLRLIRLALILCCVVDN